MSTGNENRTNKAVSNPLKGSSELHPIARELLDAYACHPYFQSKRLTATIADRNPSRCETWALVLVEPAILDATPPELIVGMLAQVRSAVKDRAPSRLSALDEIASQCWCHGTFDDASPLLQRDLGGRHYS